jgi:hypothetical protein
MFFQTKDRGTVHCVVRANTFKRATSIVQGVREDVNLGIAPLVHFSVHPDFAVSV